MTRGLSACVVPCAALLAGMLLERRADAQTAPEQPRPRLFAEVGLMAGDALAQDRSRSMGGYKFPMELGAEWKLCARPWFLGASLYVAIVSPPDSFYDNRPGADAVEISTLFRADLGRLRLGAGPVLYCEGCRAFQDVGLVARAGYRFARSLSVDTEVRAIFFDVGQPIRTLGNEVTLFAGLTARGRWAWVAVGVDLVILVALAIAHGNQYQD